MLYDLIMLPLLFVLRVLVIPWIPKARERVFYEKRASHYKGGVSFHEDGVQADIAFEFSSEGELQQCLPLIESAIAENQKIELIYFSPSVEKGVHSLYEKYPAQIRVLAFPLLTYGVQRNQSFRRWVTAKKLILVRYDFLPEIFLWGRSAEHELIIIWASFKRKRLQGKRLSVYQMLFLKLAKTIVAATDKDADYIKNHGLSVLETFDFRMIQISNRVKKIDHTLKEKFPSWPIFSEILESLPLENRFLFGNAWPVDLDLIDDGFCDQVEKGAKFFCIVPHLVGGEHLQVWREKLKELNLTYYEMTPETPVQEMLLQFKSQPGVIVLHLKGVLCELYHYFGYAYVGGGFGQSVHSLLEPYVSGSQWISCGPKSLRSTEIDLCNQEGLVVSTLLNASEFNQWTKTPRPDILEKRADNVLFLETKFENLKQRLLHVKKSL